MTMQGFPPPPEQRWRLADWQGEATNAWSFKNLREVVPTAKVGHGPGPARPLPPSDTTPAALDEPVVLVDGSAGTPAEVLTTTHTDGVLVIAGGRVVAESYPGGMAAGQTHLLMSVSKSIVGCVAAVLIDSGVLGVDDPLTSYIPELRRCGYDRASVRHVLDMRSGIEFSEAYLDPGAHVRVIEQVMGWATRSREDLPTSIYDYLLTLRASRPHGGAFEYRSCETDVLGWACERASGRRMPDLISQLLWSPMGAADDADAAVDPAGAVLHDGGLSATLRDLARFGLLILDQGSRDGAQVVPRWWFEDSLAGDPDSRQAFAADPDSAWLPGGMYRNQFWVPFADRQVLLCLGIHGQLVWVDHDRNLVVAKLSHWPEPQNLELLLNTIRAIDAIRAVDAVGR